MYFIYFNCVVQNLIYKRDSSFRSSPIAKDPSHYANYEVSSLPEEWKFVERLLPLDIIPSAPDNNDLPSGWKPQTGKYNLLRISNNQANDY